MPEKKEIALKVANIRILLKLPSSYDGLAWRDDFIPFFLKPPFPNSFDIVISAHCNYSLRDSFRKRIILDADRVKVFYLPDEKKFYFVVASFDKDENNIEILLKRNFMRRNSIFYIEQPLVFKIKREELPLTPRTAIFNKDFSKGDIFMQRFSRQSLFQNPIAPPLFKIVITNFLSSLEEGGLIFHGSGVREGDNGYLFLGKSGCGKSTMLKIWKRENENINIRDENVIIRRIGNSFSLFSLPGYAAKVDLHFDGTEIKKIFFLRHASKNYAKKIDPSSAPYLLLRNSNFHLSIQSLDSLLGFCRGLASNIPCYSLGFRPDSNIINFLRKID